MNAATLLDKPQDAQVDSATVRSEVARILDHPSFKQSERCSKLLRFLAEASLAENSLPLKERTIGHEVFGRDPDYDTYSDPVVRNAASEVRRRLREYYHEPNYSNLRVEFPNGRYHLNFHPVENEPLVEPELEPVLLNALLPLPVAQPDSLASLPATTPQRRTWAYVAAAILLILVAIVAVGRYFYTESRNAFWDPIFATKTPFVLSLNTYKHEDGFASKSYLFNLATSSGFATTSAFLQNHGAKFWMKPDVDTTLEDIRNNTTVIIGSMSHVWIERLEGQFRYRCIIDPDTHFAYLQDTFNPSTRWREGPDVSYGVVGRFTSPITGGTVIILSGGHGVSSAAEFVTDPRYTKTLNDILAHSKSNVEIILKSSVIGGLSGSPEVVAVYSW